MEGPAATNLSDISRPEEGGRAGTTSVILSVFFLLLSPAWYLETDTRRTGGQRSSGSSYVRRLQCQLPVFGLYLVTVASTSIILSTLHLTGHTARDLTNITLLAAFSLCGLLHISLFYLPSLPLLSHRNISHLGLVLCFLLELLLLHPDDHLLALILCCLAVSVLKLVHTTTILTFSLVIFTMVQGTWLLHSSLLPTSDSMTNLYFSWHILAVFIITTALNIMFHLLSRQERKTQTPSTSSRLTTASSLNISTPSPVTINNPTGLTVTINQDALARTKLNKSEDNLSKETTCKVAASVISDSEDNTSFASVPTQLASVVDSEHCERVSPLEEFNTLHRHCEGVRKSIKLKESSIV